MISETLINMIRFQKIKQCLNIMGGLFNTECNRSIFHIKRKIKLIQTIEHLTRLVSPITGLRVFVRNRNLAIGQGFKGQMLHVLQLMRMMLAPNSIVRQKERAQGEEEEEAGGRRKSGSTGTPTLGADAPIDPTWSVMSDARIRKKHGRGGMEYQSRGGQRPVIFSHDRNGGTYRMKNEVVKGYLSKAQEGLILSGKFSGKQSEGHCYGIKETWKW